MNALDLLPLELWCEIAKFSPELWHSLCLAVLPLGRHSLLTRTQRWIQDLFFVNGYYDQGRSLLKSRTWRVGRKIHRDNDQPAVLLYRKDNGKIFSKQYYQNGILHRDDDLPAFCRYWDNGSLAMEAWYRDGALQRVNKAHACKIYYHSNGSITKKCWHRSDNTDFIEVGYPEKKITFQSGKFGVQGILATIYTFTRFYQDIFSFFFDDYQSFVVNCEL